MSMPRPIALAVFISVCRQGRLGLSPFMAAPGWLIDTRLLDSGGLSNIEFLFIAAKFRTRANAHARKTAGRNAAAVKPKPRPPDAHARQTSQTINRKVIWGRKR